MRRRSEPRLWRAAPLRRAASTFSDVPEHVGDRPFRAGLYVRARSSALDGIARDQHDRRCRRRFGTAAPESGPRKRRLFAFDLCANRFCQAARTFCSVTGRRQARCARARARLGSVAGGTGLRLGARAGAALPRGRRGDSTAAAPPSSSAATRAESASSVGSSAARTKRSSAVSSSSRAVAAGSRQRERFGEHAQRAHDRRLRRRSARVRPRAARPRARGRARADAESTRATSRLRNSAISERISTCMSVPASLASSIARQRCRGVARRRRRRAASRANSRPVAPNATIEGRARRPSRRRQSRGLFEHRQRVAQTAVGAIGDRRQAPRRRSRSSRPRRSRASARSSPESAMRRNA